MVNVIHFCIQLHVNKEHALCTGWNVVNILLRSYEDLHFQFKNAIISILSKMSVLQNSDDITNFYLKVYYLSTTK